MTKALVLGIVAQLWTLTLYAQNRREPPYPQEDGEFLNQDQKQEYGLVTVEDENGKTSKVPHPFAKHGLIRVTRTGEHIFNKKQDRIEPEQSSLKDVKDIDKSGSYRFSSKQDQAITKETSALKAEGISQIRKDGTYIYSEKLEKPKKSFSLQAGTVSAPIIQRVLPATGRVISYEDIYGNQSNSGFFLQRQGFISGQSIYYLVGAGLSLNSGKGIFASTGEAARETIQFISVPLEVGIGTRLIVVDGQWFTPYLSIGGGGNLVGELRADNAERNRLTYMPSVTGVAGLALSMRAFSEARMRRLNAEYGFKNMWFTAEFRRNQVFDPALDVSSNIVTLGLLIDL